MTTKTAIDVSATTFTAECPCGGSVLSDQTGSYQLDGDGPMTCDTCGSAIRIGKTARISK